MQNSISHPKESGFGLVEVLISIVVLTFGLLALAPLSAIVVSNNVLSSRITLATAFAQNQLEVYRRIPFAQVPAVGTILHAWIAPATLTPYTSSTSTPPSGCPKNALHRVTSFGAVGSAANMRMVQVVVWWGSDAFHVTMNTVVSQ